MIPRTPPLEWRIRVWSGNAWQQGTPKEELTPERGPMSLDALNLTPQGDSLDGSFSLVPAGLALEPRDTLTVDLHDGATWVPTYAGIITTAGNPRSTDRQTYRTAGIRQRLFETINQTGWVEEGDVAAQVRAVLSASHHRPAGMTYTASDVPDLGFQLGPRATAYETVGDFLDAMAAYVGAFAVPPGETYTYDGHTYQAGEIVPPTRWGVRPDGAIFFRRPAPTDAATFAEGDQRTDVEWAQINAEDATGDIVLLYVGAANVDDPGVKFRVASANIPPLWSTSDPTEVIMQPIARLNGREVLDVNNAPTHATRHQVDGPLDLMDPVAASRFGFGVLEDVTGVPDGPDWPANTVDGNPNTYVELKPSLYEPPPVINPVTTYTASLPTDQRDKEGVWKMVYRLENPGDEEEPLIHVDLGSSVGISYYLLHTGTDRRTLWLPNLLPARWNQDPRWPLGMRPIFQITWGMFGDRTGRFLRIYELAYYTPDCDHYTTEATRAGSRSARYADAHRREPSPEVAQITYYGRGPQAHELQVIPQDGAPVTAWAERITLALTTANGITTTYYAGQEWPAQVQEQRVLLERLARRSVTDGGRRR